MMRKWALPITTMIVIVILLTACNNKGQEESADNNADSYSESNAMEMDHNTEEAKSTNSGNNSEGGAAKQEERATADVTSNRMVVYTADMTIAIADFQQRQQDIQSLVEQAGGYIVNSSVTSVEDNQQQGHISARIPQEAFNAFLDDVEAVADHVQDRSVSGEDVTKEYVDLESRLQAKEDVKKRLDNLLQEANDTDDLLDISNKLGETQEEIEKIRGQMQYLDNHSALSTVNITMLEKGVDTGSVKNKDDLNTWQKTKKALVTSTNAIFTFFSGVVIFLVGYSPILIPIIVIAGLIYWVYRRRIKK